MFNSSSPQLQLIHIPLTQYLIIMRLVKHQVKEEAKVKKQANDTSHQSWEAIIPAAKVSPEVIEILRTTKVPELIIPNHTTIPGAAKIYFDEYLKLFGKNRQLNAELIQIFEERNMLAEKYNQLKREENDCEDTIRRKRRFANQIRRDFICPSSNCHKSYGSEGSLTQHVKLKHDQFYKSGEYEVLLQKMLDDMAKLSRPTKKEEEFSKKQQVKTKNQREEKQRQKEIENDKEGKLLKELKEERIKQKQQNHKQVQVPKEEKKEMQERRI